MDKRTWDTANVKLIKRRFSIVSQQGQPGDLHTATVTAVLVTIRYRRRPYDDEWHL